VDRVPERRSCSGRPSGLEQSPAYSRRQAPSAGRIHGAKPRQKVWVVWLAVLCVVLAAGCGHRQPVQAQIPQPPQATPLPATAPPAPPQKQPGEEGSARQPAVANPSPGKSTPRPAPAEEITVPPNAKVLYKEVGWASWYGPGFQNRQAANGEVFDTERMTAAHRTLPLNSIVRVTNLKTNESALVRITDRGPFVGDRI